MKLFRIEHAETGNGMWTDKFDGQLVLEYLTDRRLIEMPMPYDPTFNADGKRFKTAVDTLDAMAHWFTRQDVVEMVDHGFVMLAFEAPEVIIQQYQILYNSDLRLGTEDITQDFLKTAEERTHD